VKETKNKKKKKQKKAKKGKKKPMNKMSEQGGNKKVFHWAEFCSDSVLTCRSFALLSAAS